MRKEYERPVVEMVEFQTEENIMTDLDGGDVDVDISNNIGGDWF